MTDRIDKITNTKKAEGKTPAYSDFMTNFNKHPESDFLLKITDENAVKRSLRNLLSTERGERRYRPDLGSNHSKILFEMISKTSEDALKTYITEAISYEPRVSLIDVVVVGVPERHLYNVGIVYSIINNTNIQTLNLTLYRVR